jgi:hypothetical protein
MKAKTTPQPDDPDLRQSQSDPVTQKSKPGVGFQKPAEKRAPIPSKSLRDLAESGRRGRNAVDSGKRLRDVVDSVANEAKYKVVVLKEGNKSELEGPLKDLLGKPKESASRKSENY